MKGIHPAKVGIQYLQIVATPPDSGFHRSDDFLRDHLMFNIRILFKFRGRQYLIKPMASKNGAFCLIFLPLFWHFRNWLKPG